MIHGFVCFCPSRDEPMILIMYWARYCIFMRNKTFVFSAHSSFFHPHPQTPSLLCIFSALTPRLKSQRHEFPTVSRHKAAGQGEGKAVPALWEKGYSMKECLIAHQNVHKGENLHAFPCSRTSTRRAQPKHFHLQPNSEKKKFPEVIHGYSPWDTAGVQPVCLGH